MTDDRRQFAALVDAHQSRLQRFACRMLGGDADAAADLVQEAFVRLWPRRELWCDDPGHAAGWLTRVVHNLCCDIGRQPGAAPWPDDELPDRRPGPDEMAIHAAVRDAVAALPDTQKSVFILSYYEGLRYDEIAALLEIPPGTVASRKNAAVASLRRRLEDWIL